MAESGEAVLHRVIEAPELYIDGYQGAIVQNGVVKLNCYSSTLDPATGEPVNICVARLAMSLPGLLGVHAALGQLIEMMQADGVIALSHTGEPDA
jgi:hypothetical protein